MNYIKYSFQLSGSVSGEILMAHLSEFKFESFVENESNLEAYIPENDLVNEVELKHFLSEVGVPIDFQTELIEEQNWNEKWESDYPVVAIGNELIVRAPFHQIEKDTYRIDIQIQPKMSFGTGHHETTFLMLQYLLDAALENKSLLDMGSGTGVLAIAAQKLGAKDILAVDIESWAYENTIENISLNSAHIDVNKGNVSTIKGRSFDIILANINKNVLLADMKAYATSLNKNGSLYLSGFFGIDIDDISRTAGYENLNLASTKVKGNWAAMHLIKTN